MRHNGSANWVPRKLNELGFVGRGKSRHRPRNAPELYGGSYPFVQTADIAASDLYITRYTKTYSELGLAQSKLWRKGTLCITIAGENTAENAILGFDACIPDSIIGFIADPTKADTHFVKYYLDILKPQIRAITKGATQDNLSLDKLLSFKILTPLPPVQRRIGDILGSYGDLIENNTRRISILEAMAAVIYREWFVYFRFPGHQGVRMIDSPHGKVPEGWRIDPLGDCCKLVMGQSPDSEFYNEQGQGLPFHQGVTDFGDYFPEDRMYCTVTNRLAQEGDILFSVRAPVGRINVALHQMVIGRGIAAIRANNGKQPFLLHQLKEKFAVEDSMGGGTIFKAVTKDDMRGIKLVWPSEPFLSHYDGIAAAMLSQIRLLSLKNRNLRKTRDLLLPKLISGDVDVSKLDLEKESVPA